ncbi:hypothetical protein [Clostridium butyricum]|uniref:hypothetical protein n=1 Tax=Clostridium butyricum TaxID=1492 RepID=UPI00374E8F95
MFLFYKGFHNTGICNIDKFGRVFLVTQDVSDYPCTSITNAAEVVAQAICEKYEIKPEELIFIEHYKGDNYKLISFSIQNNKFIDPRWRRIELEELKSLISANATENEVENFIVNERKKIEKEFKDRMDLLTKLCSHEYDMYNDIDKKRHCFYCNKISD